MTKHSYFSYTSTYSSTRHNTNRKYNIHHIPYTNIQPISILLSSNPTIFDYGRYTTTFPQTPHRHYNIVHDVRLYSVLDTVVISGDPGPNFITDSKQICGSFTFHTDSNNRFTSLIILSNTARVTSFIHIAKSIAIPSIPHPGHHQPYPQEIRNTCLKGQIQ